MQKIKINIKFFIFFILFKKKKKYKRNSKQYFLKLVNKISLEKYIAIEKPIYTCYVTRYERKSGKYKDKREVKKNKSIFTI